MCFIGEGNIGVLRRKCEGDGKCRADHHLLPQTSHLLDQRIFALLLAPRLSIEIEDFPVFLVSVKFQIQPEANYLIPGKKPQNNFLTEARIIVKIKF